ncbi:hypothetical protein MXEN_15707 [Mycobacterium xenopi RIVM700367]|nr:hypothetical protein MXEN_15707 [Mycobacterium xenopi RIVM700367]
MLKEITGVPAGIQAVEAVGTVTADDYQRVFAPVVDRARQTGTRMRLPYQIGPGFERITPRGAVGGHPHRVGLLESEPPYGHLTSCKWLIAWNVFDGNVIRPKPVSGDNALLAGRYRVGGLCCRI